jgi:hypothetical protein
MGKKFSMNIFDVVYVSIFCKTLICFVLNAHARCCNVYLDIATKVLNGCKYSFLLYLFVSIVEIVGDFCCQSILVGNNVVITFSVLQIYGSYCNRVHFFC